MTITTTANTENIHMATAQGKVGECKKATPPYTLDVHKPTFKVLIFSTLILIIGSGIILNLRAYMAFYHARQAREKLDTGYWAKATQHAWRTVALRPGNADYRGLLALALERQAIMGLNRFEYLKQAAGELNRALALNPLDGDLWLQLARVAEKIENLRALSTDHQMNRKTLPAEDCFQQAVELDPHNIYYLISAAAYYARKGVRDKAEHLFAQAWQFSPNTVNRYYIAWEQRQEALDSVVISYLSKQVAAGTGDKLIFYCLGGLYEAIEDYAAARKTYRQGLKTTGVASFENLIKRTEYRSGKK